MTFSYNIVTLFAFPYIVIPWQLEGKNVRLGVVMVTYKHLLAKSSEK